MSFHIVPGDSPDFPDYGGRLPLAVKFSRRLLVFRKALMASEETKTIASDKKTAHRGSLDLNFYLPLVLDIMI